MTTTAAPLAPVPATVTPRHVAATRDEGLRAFGWDAQTGTAVERLIGLGIDGLYADHPDLLVARVAAARDGAARATAAAPRP
jgi:hypothetical protein